MNNIEPESPFLFGKPDEEILQAMRLGLEAKGKYRGLQEQYERAREMADTQLGGVRGSGLAATAPSLAQAVAVIARKYQGAKKMSDLEQQFSDLSKQEAQGDLAKFRLSLADKKSDAGLFQKVNPSDFTEESLSNFQKSGNYGDLVRVREFTETPQQERERNLRAAIEKEIAIQEFKDTNAGKKLKSQHKQKLAQAGEIYNTLAAADLDKIYGFGENLIPDALRSQQSIDLMAQRDQLVSMLELAAAGEMKGQGEITGPERKLLKDAATSLGNPRISPALARKKLDDAMRVLYNNAGMEWSGPYSGNVMTGKVQRASPEELEAKAAKYGL